MRVSPPPRSAASSTTSPVLETTRALSPVLETQRAVRSAISLQNERGGAVRLQNDGGNPNGATRSVASVKLGEDFLGVFADGGDGAARGEDATIEPDR